MTLPRLLAAMPPHDSLLIDVELPRRPDAGATARRILGEQLSRRLGTGALSDARLVVSELVNNAYLHGTGRIRLRVRAAAGRIRVEVIDEGAGAAVRIRDPDGGIGGRGLRIVDSLALRWGAFDGTTHVWADLAA